jgi:glycosyltransferase EpsF
VRIIHVIHWLNRGGLETWLLDLLRKSVEAQVVMDVCCKGGHVGEMAPLAETLGAMVIHCPGSPLELASGRFSRRLECLLAQGRYDVVHSHLGDLSMPVLSAAVRAGTPRRVVTYHQTEHRYERVGGLGLAVRWAQLAARRRIAEQATDILACSQTVMARTFPVKLPDRAYFITYPPVDTARFKPGGASASGMLWPSPRKSGRLRVVHVGNLVHAKNQGTILRVAALTRQAGVDAEFAIAGEGQLRGQLERAIARSGLGERVFLLGRCSDVPSLLREADVAIHPSVTEGLPVSVLEYQASALPVVGSSIPAVAESIAPAGRNYLFRPDDPEGYADAVARLAGDEALRRELGSAARCWVMSNFSLESAFEQIMSIYLRG